MDHLFFNLHHEYSHYFNFRDLTLKNLVQLILINISRNINSIEESQRNHKNGQSYIENFKKIIEDNFKENHNLSSYAQQLGITTTYLNILCQRITGVKASKILCDRLILEAKRQLQYTNLTISQISDSLGFSDPAYFTRFFKREVNISPKEFRKNNL